MVFISGPRQVGKTTLAKGILSDHFSSGRYLDWNLCGHAASASGRPDYPFKHRPTSRFLPKRRRFGLKSLRGCIFCLRFARIRDLCPGPSLNPPKSISSTMLDVLAGEGEQFENLVATSLLKRLHFLEDREGYRYELRYLRDKEGREIDFVIIKENRVEELIEAKWSDDKISKSLLYYAERLKPEKATQITAHLRRPYSQGRIRVTDPLSYFRLDFFTSAEAIKANS